MNHSFSFVVIGAGAAGLVVSIGLAKAGKNVCLIENDNFGGDCTNFGCVPSKKLISLAKKQTIKDPMDQVHATVSHFRQGEDKEALEKHNITVLNGLASFENEKTLLVQSKDTTHMVEGETIVICCGSKPAIADIQGLDSVPYLTNESLFTLNELPQSIAIIGGGPIGCEMAQALARLGVKVTLLQSNRRLTPREEPEFSEIILEQFKKENIEVYLNTKPLSVAKEKEGISIQLPEKTIEAESLLLAAGRIPDINRLNLEQAGVKFASKGIEVNRTGQTSQKNIYALGDCAGPPFFTHLAEYQARAFVINTLNPLPFKGSIYPKVLPKVTFTDPEIASAGLTEEQACQKYGKAKIKTYYISANEIDRATITEEVTSIKIITKSLSSKILGASIIGPRAGEMLMELVVCMDRNIPLRKLSSIIHPYPIFSRGIRKLADQWFLHILSIIKFKKSS